MLRRNPSFDPSEVAGSVEEDVRSGREEERKQGVPERGSRPGGQALFSFAGQSDPGETLLWMIRNANTPEAKEELNRKYREWEEEKTVP